MSLLSIVRAAGVTAALWLALAHGRSDVLFESPELEPRDAREDLLHDRMQFKVPVGQRCRDRVELEAWLRQQNLWGPEVYIKYSDTARACRNLGGAWGPPTACLPLDAALASGSVPAVIVSFRRLE